MLPLNGASTILLKWLIARKKKGQKILPIFYKVKPSYVKEISRRYGKHMNKHEKVVDAAVYAKWEQALKEVGSSKGLESKKFADGYLLSSNSHQNLNLIL